MPSVSHRRAEKTYVVTQALFLPSKGGGIQGGGVFTKKPSAVRRPGRYFSEKPRYGTIVANQPARRQTQALTQGLI